MPILSLSVGSNIDATNNIRSAISELAKEFGKLHCSNVFESESVGFFGDNFLNLVVIIEASGSLADISKYLKSLEDRLGRDRSAPRFSGRKIDIDILTYGDSDGAECGITLPRPEITRNAFVLQPLAELLPFQFHGDSGNTFGELWESFDKERQRLWVVPFDWQDALSGGKG